MKLRRNTPQKEKQKPPRELKREGISRRDENIKEKKNPKRREREWTLNWNEI